MFTKDMFMDAVQNEVRLCKHLYDKLPEGQNDYRPADNMRSTLELLRYLTYAGIAAAEAMLSDDWSTAKVWADRAADMTAEQFPDRMDEQVRQLTKLMEPITQAELTERIASLPTGDKRPLGEALVNTTLRFLTAYRMQLFIYAKASGASSLSTYNNWLGQDAPTD